MSTDNNTPDIRAEVTGYTQIAEAIFDPNHALVINFSNRKRLDTDPAFRALYEQTIRMIDMTTLKSIPIPAGMHRRVVFDPATLLSGHGSNGRVYVTCMYELGPRIVGETGGTLVISDKADVRKTGSTVENFADYDEVPPGGPGGVVHYYETLDQIPDVIQSRLYKVTKPYVTGDMVIDSIGPTVRVWYIDEPM